MNVVGKVGSLITQGVYSVATPFHPFGGAVDIIVVQQQDGTFRSTPWYVQFGKFQGVLKGAEKVVRINVNGVEADFHMYLDNSGEAYFVRKADSSKDSEKSEAVTDDREGALEHSLSVDNSKCSLNNDNGENFRLQSTLSDPGILRDDYSTFRPDVLERTDSDVCRFYDFQDDQSFDGELSPEYGSSRYDNLDGADNFMEAQGSDSEMVLVSVDGHILTAPILSSEQNTENVQLVTPQFHLGPGEGNGFCEGDTKFTVSENAWDPEFMTDLDASSNKVESVIASCENGLVEKCKDEELALERQDRDTFNNLSEAGHDVEINDTHASESCKEFDESAIKSPEHGSTDWKSVEYEDTHNLDPNKVSNKDVHEGHGVEDARHSEDQNEEKEQAHQDHDSDAEDVSPSVKKDKFQSCLDLTAAAIGETSQGDDSTLKVREQLSEEIPLQKVNLSSDIVVTDINIGNAGEDKAEGELSPSASSKTVLSSQESENIKRANTGLKDMNSECMPTGNASLNEDDQVRLDALPETANNSRDRDFTENELGRSGNPLSSSEQEQASFKLGKASAMNDLTGGDFTETDPNRSEVLNSHSSSEQEQANLNLALEISLCGHLLRPGMGLVAANEAFNSHRVSEKEFKSTAVSVIKNENLVIRLKEKYFLWDQAAHIVLGMTAFGLDLSIDSKDAIQVEQEVTPKLVENDPGSTSGRRWRLWPIAFRRVKTIQHTNSSSSEEVFVDSESVSQNPSVHLTPTSQSGTPRSATKSPLKRIVRTNIPTNEQIESLNLKDGQNNVTFSFSTRVLGVQQVEAHIYLWKWNARIVISDVDGTITKSDVLGQFMPLVGKDWSQSGVARLFSAIKENGYQLLFLSARAIVQAYLTKSFLFNLKQDGKTLPNGPVVISPNGLFPSLFREVIRRAPHEFKIACLEDIKALFPPDYNPFYAGFGNRDTDELTYRKLGIPKGKIFIINPKGEVAINHRIDVKSYTSLHTLVHDMFPPTSMVEQEDYNSWNYWKMPVIDIDE